jgi:hypothetical protein
MGKSLSCQTGNAQRDPSPLPRPGEPSLPPLRVTTLFAASEGTSTPRTTTVHSRLPLAAQQRARRPGRPPSPCWDGAEWSAAAWADPLAWSQRSDGGTDTTSRRCSRLNNNACAFHRAPTTRAPRGREGADQPRPRRLSSPLDRVLHRADAGFSRAQFRRARRSPSPHPSGAPVAPCHPLR